MMSEAMRILFGNWNRYFAGKAQREICEEGSQDEFVLMRVWFHGESIVRKVW